MKKIGFVDYYIGEWHANEYPELIANIVKETGEEEMYAIMDTEWKCMEMEIRR